MTKPQKLFLTCGMLLLLSFLTSTIGCTKKEQNAVRREVPYSSLEKKGDLFYLKGETQPFTGTAIEYQPDGKLKGAVFAYENGKLHGPAFLYYEDGTIAGEFAHKNGVGHGTLREFYKNGQKKLEVQVIDEKKEGVETQWYENGEKKSEITYKEGKLNGPYRTWDVNGQIIQKFEAKQE
jgi:antitoxin component YwqK of YwqJK toxin-antitoxin module